uniref:Polygalacturonase n=1 Tax=Cannabis sativa TaxID=3483 RepID=A0A803QEK4_CANSA
MRFGAKPNGQSDSTEAFLQAWAAACASTESALIYVPKGRYLLRPLIFLGPCKSPHIMFRIDGTLVAPTDYRVLGGVENWINFKRVSSVTILGGSLDAKGPALWACKAKPNNSCPIGATVQIKGVRILAKENSPNTDGIHLQFSKNIAIFNSSVKTGDDCVSIGPGTQNLLIQRMACGPGHGISIGSLAKELEEEGVRNITVKEVVFTETQNGVRIKSWARPSLGFVKEVQFFNIVMRNVRNPIIIDQNYCPHSIDCPNQV